MKRAFVFFLAVLTLLALCACGGYTNNNGQISRITEEASPSPAAETAEPEPTEEPAPEPTFGPVVEQPDLSNAPDAIGEAQQAILEQFILIDEVVAPGTAGSSLRSATAAASLLDWAENAELTQESLNTVIDYMAAKSIEGQAEFAEKLDSVEYAAEVLTGSDSEQAEGLLSDAGMLEQCGYPWSAKAVQTVESLMQALGRRAG